jgi:hypothetical protein
MIDRFCPALCPKVADADRTATTVMAAIRKKSHK